MLSGAREPLDPETESRGRVSGVERCCKENKLNSMMTQ